MKKTFIQAAKFSIALLTIFSFISCSENKKKTVKVGLLHSLTGTMSISEIAVRNAELLAAVR